MGTGKFRVCWVAKRLEIQVRAGVVVLSPSAAAQQAGDLGRFSIYPPEESSSFIRKPQSLLLNLQMIG